MDSRPLYEHNVAGATLPNRLFETLRFSVKTSPNSPYLTNSESGDATTLSDGREQQSSADNIFRVSTSYNSSLDTSSCFERSSPSVECHGVPSQNENCDFWELEGVIMGPQTSGREEIEETATPPDISFRENANTIESESKTATARQWDSKQQGSQFIVGESPYPEDILSGDLKQLLVACAKAVAEEKIVKFDQLIERARTEVSISGEPIQRLGAYLIEGLVARKESSGANIYRALRCREPESKDMLSYMQILYEICPYLKFGYMAANGAIAEACRNEDSIHIVDFQIAQGTQWMTLLQALAARPGGPPRVRITGIDDAVSKFARGGGLDVVERRLAVVSEKFRIPVEFHGLPVFAPRVTAEMLGVRSQEDLVVNFPLMLHHTPDESVDVNNPRDGLLRMIKSLSPKVVIIVEQESNTNTAPFLNRFEEALDYYLAMFE